MSAQDEPVKRWTAERKSAVVKEIWKGKTTVAEVERRHDLTPREVKGWIDKAACVRALTANAPIDALPLGAAAPAARLCRRHLRLPCR